MTASYEQDYGLWAEQMADLLASGRFSELDIENLVEEVRDLSKWLTHSFFNVMFDTAIAIKNLSKKYIIGNQKQERYRLLRNAIADGARSFWRSHNKFNFPLI